MNLKARLVIASAKAENLSKATYDTIMKPIEHINHKKNLKERLVVAERKVIAPMSKQDVDMFLASIG
jgi:hypothetical protein